MDDGENIGFDYRGLIKNRNVVEVVNIFHVLHLRKPALPCDITNNPEVDWHACERIMLVLHNENTFGCDRKVFTKLFVPSDTRLIYFKMRSEIINLDDTQISILNHAAVSEGGFRQIHGGNKDKQETQDNTAHNHISILTLIPRPRKNDFNSEHCRVAARSAHLRGR